VKRIGFTRVSPLSSERYACVYLGRVCQPLASTHRGAFTLAGMADAVQSLVQCSRVY